MLPGTLEVSVGTYSRPVSIYSFGPSPVDGQSASLYEEEEPLFRDIAIAGWQHDEIVWHTKQSKASLRNTEALRCCKMRNASSREF